jgi:hypothetical protein
MNDAKPSESRVSLVLRTFCALPVFLLLTVVFWELALGAWLLAAWFDDRGWPVLGFSATVVWAILVALTSVITVWGCIAWVVHLVRVARGRET